MKRVCVFCGSSCGNDAAFADAAASLGRLLASSGIDLVYGGGRTGLMGAIADAAMAAGGQVIGVIPRMLVAKEIAHPRLTKLHPVESMHQRKTMMYDLSDAFIALPGGLGTIEEFFEILTWNQLGIAAKPCGILNVSGFYDGLLKFLDHMIAVNLLLPEHRGLVLEDTTPQSLLGKMREWKPAYKPKWIDLPQT